jgi:hypothetical protein
MNGMADCERPPQGDLCEPATAGHPLIRFGAANPLTAHPMLPNVGCVDAADRQRISGLAPGCLLFPHPLPASPEQQAADARMETPASHPLIR